MNEDSVAVSEKPARNHGSGVQAFVAVAPAALKAAALEGGYAEGGCAVTEMAEPTRACGNKSPVVYRA